jgi:hypothetical protein
MCVEKAPPDIVKALPIIDVHFDKGGQLSGQKSGLPHTHKRAIDFM